MRKLFATGSVAFCLTTLWTGLFASAQEKTPPSGTPTRPYVAPMPRDSRSYSLIHERALVKAQQRTARMETRMWMGQSTARPVMGPGGGTMDIFSRVDHGGMPRYGSGGGHYGPYGAPYIVP